MGIALSTTRLFSRVLKESNFSGNCLTYGVQGIEGQYLDVKKVLSEEKYNFRELEQDEIKYDDKTQFGKSLHQESFFKMMGFTTVESVDYFPDENPSYLLDLNEPVPKALWNQYDLVYDGGTTEHCFNIKEALSNAVRLLKIGGRVVHHLPMSGWIEHGYYQFSPGLLFNFYVSNGFEEFKAFIHILGEKSYYIEYQPRLAILFNNMKKCTLIFFTSKKKMETNTIMNPIQSYYVALFDKRNKEISKKNLKDKVSHFCPVN